jgi:hypothetical protein
MNQVIAPYILIESEHFKSYLEAKISNFVSSLRIFIFMS